MEKYEVTSSFESLPIEIFWYPSRNKTPHTVLLLKGLYGLHEPNSSGSWDNKFIQNCNNKCNIISINTARKGTSSEERLSKEAFIGKTFEQECNDIELGYQYLLNNSIILPSSILHVIGNSFGGTTLLGMPKMLDRALSVVMIGSGCGKSQTTTKPLLQTLFEEEILLQSMQNYGGLFTYIRGADDSVVPKESQDKIILNSTGSSIQMIYTLREAKHDLTPSSNALMADSTKILTSIFEHTRYLLS